MTQPASFSEFWKHYYPMTFDTPDLLDRHDLAQAAWTACLAACIEMTTQHRLDDKHYFGADGRLIDPERSPTLYEMGQHNTAVSIATALKALG